MWEATRTTGCGSGPTGCLPGSSSFPAAVQTAALRFFASPYDPNVIYLLDKDRVMRSNDGGVSWQVDGSLQQQLSRGPLIPVNRGEDDDGQGDHLDLVLTDMQFDPNDPGRRFAVGLGGAFMTRDGANWERLLDTGALRGRPSNCYFDGISNPSDPALYVAFAGRSIVKISALSLLSLNVKMTDGHVGRTGPMPDNRVLITLTDGRSFVVDAERLRPQGDGTYLIVPEAAYARPSTAAGDRSTRARDETKLKEPERGGDSAKPRR